MGMSFVTLGLAGGIRSAGRGGERAVAEAVIADRRDPHDPRRGGAQLQDATHRRRCRARGSRSRGAGFSGHFLIDGDVLRETGVSDFDAYAVEPGQPLLPGSVPVGRLQPRQVRTGLHGRTR